MQFRLNILASHNKTFYKCYWKAVCERNFSMTKLIPVNILHIQIEIKCLCAIGK